jgi:hypothetical protein
LNDEFDVNLSDSPKKLNVRTSGIFKTTVKDGEQSKQNGPIKAGKLLIIKKSDVKIKRNDE